MAPRQDPSALGLGTVSSGRCPQRQARRRLRVWAGEEEEQGEEAAGRSRCSSSLPGCQSVGAAQPRGIGPAVPAHS